MDAAAEALSMLATTQGITLLLIGTLIGTLVAIVPGLGAPVALAVLIPVTFALSPSEALTLLVPVIGAGGFAGSMTAILVGVPGDETNAATTLDGSELARQGRAGEAIGASATASALGALIGVGILVASIPLIRSVILSVGPSEVFTLAVFGMLMVGAISARGGRLKGVVCGFLGMALGLVGFNYALGGVRFTFGIGDLNEGIPVVPALIGLFAIPEAVMMLRARHSISATRVARGGVLRGVRAVLKRPRLVIQSSLLGTSIGAVPGIGGSIICWISYFAAQRTSQHPEEFGRGSIEGVIGPEASIDSKDGGQLMPLLALGIPGGISTAILAGAFLLHGIQPGLSMFTSNVSLVYLMVFALIFANLTTSLLGLATANLMVKVTRVPPYVLAPLVIALAGLGSYVASGSFYGLLMFLLFGGVGYLIVRGGYSRAAVVVGLILLPIVESNFHVALQSSRGELTFLLRPGTVAILAVGVAVFLLPPVWRLVRRRSRPGAAMPGEDGSAATTSDTHGPRSRPVTGGTDADPTASALMPEPGARVAVRDPEGDINDERERALVEHATLQREAYSPLADLVVAILAVGVGLLFLVEATRLLPDQRLIPTLLLPLLVFTGGAAAVRAVRGWRLSQQVSEYTRRDAAAALGVLALPLLMYVIGATPAIFLWTAVAMVAYAARARRLTRNLIGGLVLMALLFSLGLDALVTDVLNLRLPGGLLF